MKMYKFSWTDADDMNRYSDVMSEVDIDEVQHDENWNENTFDWEIEEIEE